MRYSAVLAAFVAASAPAWAEPPHSSGLSEFEVVWTRQADIVGCVRSHERDCRMAALVLPQTDDGTCVEALVSEQYRFDTAATPAVPIIVEVAPDGPGSGTHGTFYKALVSPSREKPDRVCVPRLIKMEAQVFRISIWQPPEQPVPPTRFPLDAINAFSARLNARDNAPTKGWWDELNKIIVGTSARPEGKGALEVRISSQDALDVFLGGTVHVVTNITRYLTPSQISLTSIKKAGTRLPLTSCDGTLSENHWSISYRC
jgi:hypothetical protein